MSSDSRKGTKSESGRVIRLGSRVQGVGTEPFRSTEALAALVSELAKFENAAKSEAEVPPESQARVAELATMRAGKSPLSVKREVEPSAETLAPAVPLPKRTTKRSKKT